MCTLNYLHLFKISTLEGEVVHMGIFLAEIPGR